MNNHFKANILWFIVIDHLNKNAFSMPEELFRVNSPSYLSPLFFGYLFIW